ncbi:MAG: ribonuclease P protein component [Gammaproteobacteria bacterium]|nr:ribonuclease P protein component [Gammaproteobacteria bacterium]
MTRPQAGFPPHRRLHASKEFGRVFADPVRSSDSLFTILARPNAAEVSRLGLAISRKAAKRAVDRNRLKRIARESFRQQPNLPAWDFVVMARPAAARATADVIRSSLDRHFAHLARRAESRRNG